MANEIKRCLQHSKAILKGVGSAEDCLNLLKPLSIYPVYLVLFYFIFVFVTVWNDVFLLFTF